MKVVCVGASGFVGKNLLNYLPSIRGISMRIDSWKSELVESDVIINLVGKAHDFSGTATEQEYQEVNDLYVRRIFN